MASSTPGYPGVLNYKGMKGMSKNGDGGWYKCKTSGGHSDPTSKTPQLKWPHGTCCNSGGTCSNPADNKDRYVIEYAPGGGGNKEYEIHLKLPAVTCDRCVLQWAYQTANSRETYPETFWNCADVTIKATTYTGQTGCTVGDNSPPPPPPPPPATSPSPVSPSPSSQSPSPPTPTPPKTYKGWCSTKV